MERTIFDKDHDLFRSSVRDFVASEIAPFHSQWAIDGVVPRAIWTRAGALGYLCMAAPEGFGGAGVSDFRYDAILGEELTRQNCTGPGFGVHGTIVAPYILNYGTPDQLRRWVPGMVTGDTILAVGMTESTSGSDLSSLRTTATDDGDAYVVNGHKAFVSNGALADLLIVSCVTNPELKQWGVSLLAIEVPTDGVTISKPLKKIGWHAQDIDGHDLEAIKAALDTARTENHRPSVIVAHTVKGKGVSFMEDDNNWHYRTPNAEELAAALTELESV